MNVHSEIAKSLDELRKLGMYTWVTIEASIPPKNLSYKICEIYPYCPDEIFVQHESSDPVEILYFLKDCLLVEGVFHSG